MKCFMVAVCSCLFATGCIGNGINEEFSLYDKRGTNAGTASAFINGNAYIGSVTTAEYSSEIADRITLGIIVYKDKRRIRKLEIQQLNPELENQQIISTSSREACSACFILQRADTVESRYHINEKMESAVHIDKYDKKKGVLRGSFKLNLFRTYMGAPAVQGFPDTLIVTQGRFDVHVKLRTCLTCM